MPFRLLAAALVACLVPAAAHAQCPDGSPPPCAARAAAPAPRPVDRNVVAVFPFHVTTSDTLLGEGFAELLTSEFTGESGTPRALDMGSVLADWRRSGGRPRTPLPRDRALQIARTLGAGLITEGSIVGLGRQLTVTARFYEVPSGRAVGTPTRVQTHADSLDSALRRTAANLLASYGAPPAANAGVRFTSSPEAMRHYIRGLAEYRRGRMPAAAAAFEQSIAIDSTFAQPIYRRFLVQFWGVPQRISGADVWAVRERLSRQDRAIIEVYLGPEPSAPYTEPEVLREFARLVVTMSDSPELVFLAGDDLYHFGALVDPIGHLARARELMQRAFAVDSQANTLRHMMEIALHQRDTAFLRRTIPLILKTDAPVRTTVAWYAASLLGDQRLFAQLRQLDVDVNATNILGLGGIPGIPQLPIDELYDRMERARPTPDQKLAFAANRVVILAYQGRFRASEPIAQLSNTHRDAYTIALLNLALADAAPGHRADSLAEVLVSRSQAGRGDWVLRNCWLSLARARLGDSVAMAPLNAPSNAASCAWALDFVQLTQSADFSRVTLARADSTYRARMNQASRGYQPYLLAQAWEKLGDPPRALAAIRLRPKGYNAVVTAPWLYYDEGRYALATGDTAGAVRAYRDYLDFTALADPPFAERREHARTELARLTRRP